MKSKTKTTIILIPRNTGYSGLLSPDLVYVHYDLDAHRVALPICSRRKGHDNGTNVHVGACRSHVT